MSNPGSLLEPEDEVTLVEAWADDAAEDTDYEGATFSGSTLQGTDWTVETIVSQLRQSNIDVSPHFQRRSVWSAQRMSRFIESLFIGFPVPQLVLAADKRRRGGFIVLDGKQRLTALQRFVLDAQSGIDSLRLTGLDLLVHMNGKNFHDLESNPVFADDLRAFMNTTIRTAVVSNWTDDRYLNLVFHRLNSGSVALSSQELRQALYPGEFSTALDKYAATSEALHAALRTREADFRMRDTELALRFVAFKLRLTDYAGNLKSFLDYTTEIYNADWERSKPAVDRALSSMDMSIETALEVFGRDAFRRYDTNRYEALFNRAVFDVQSLYFSVPEIVTAALERSSEVRYAFEELMTVDRDFVNAVSATTKSLGATQYRLEAWGRRLESVLGVSVALPSRDQSGRIIWDYAGPGWSAQI